MKAMKRKNIIIETSFEFALLTSMLKFLRKKEKSSPQPNQD